MAAKTPPKPPSPRKLIEAIYSGDLTVVRQLLDRGASVTARDPDSGSTPLGTVAMMAGATIRFFSSDPAAMASHAAQPRQHVDIIRLLVERGAGIDTVDAKGLAPLHAAALAGKPEVLALLLELGATVDRRRTGGDDEELTGGTALHHICCCPNQAALDEAVRVLLAAGADPNARTQSGATPLQLLCRAVLGGRALAAIDRLLAAGADPNLRDAHGYTARMALEDARGNPFAADGAEKAALARLGAAGAREDGVESLRLIAAARDGDLGAVRQCLDAGAAPDFTDWRGARALPAAAAAGAVEIVRELLARGADPRAGEYGERAIAPAAAQGHLDVVRLLVAAGADPSAGGPWRRPLDLAPPGSPVERFLEELGASRTLLANERGAPNFDLTQQAILVRAEAGAVGEALMRLVPGAQVRRGVKGKKVPIAKASLLAYQLAGHGWTVVQPVSGRPTANRFERALAVALSRELATAVLTYDNSDFTATVAWELFVAGESEELVYAGDRETSTELVPRDIAEARRPPGPPATETGDDEDDDAVEVSWSRSGATGPDAARLEDFLDRRCRELDVLIPSWTPRDLAAKAGATKMFFPRERKETFAAVDYVVVDT